MDKSPSETSPVVSSQSLAASSVTDKTTATAHDSKSPAATAAASKATPHSSKGEVAAPVSDVAATDTAVSQDQDQSAGNSDSAAATATASLPESPAEHWQKINFMLEQARERALHKHELLEQANTSQQRVPQHLAHDLHPFVAAHVQQAMAAEDLTTAAASASVSQSPDLAAANAAGITSSSAADKPAATSPMPFTPAQVPVAANTQNYDALIASVLSHAKQDLEQSKDTPAFGAVSNVSLHHPATTLTAQQRLQALLTAQAQHAQQAAPAQPQPLSAVPAAQPPAPSERALLHVVTPTSGYEDSAVKETEPQVAADIAAAQARIQLLPPLWVHDSQSEAVTTALSSASHSAGDITAPAPDAPAHSSNSTHASAPEVQLSAALARAQEIARASQAALVAALGKANLSAEDLDAGSAPFSTKVDAVHHNAQAIAAQRVSSYATAATATAKATATSNTTEVNTAPVTIPRAQAAAALPQDPEQKAAAAYATENVTAAATKRVVIPGSSAGAQNCAPTSSATLQTQPAVWGEQPHKEHNPFHYRGGYMPCYFIYDYAEDRLFLDEGSCRLLGITYTGDWIPERFVEMQISLVDTEQVYAILFDPSLGNKVYSLVRINLGPHQGELLYMSGSVIQRDDTGIALLLSGYFSQIQAPFLDSMVKIKNHFSSFDIEIFSGEVHFGYAYAEMLGLSDPALLPHSVLELETKYIHPDDVLAYRQQHALIDDPTLGDYYESVYRLRHSGGYYIWCIDRGLVVERNSHGRATRIIGTTTNIDVVRSNFERLKSSIYQDPLTGLHNRLYLNTRYKYFTLEESQPLSLVYVDISGLKVINDYLGHAKGDSLVKLAAHVLKNEVYLDHEVVRLSGDEFLLIFTNCSSTQCRNYIAKFAEMLDARNAEYEYPLPLYFGFGIATLHEIPDGDTFLRCEARADMRLQEYKAQHHDRIYAFLREYIEHVSGQPIDLSDNRTLEYYEHKQQEQAQQQAESNQAATATAAASASAATATAASPKTAAHPKSEMEVPPVSLDLEATISAIATPEAPLGVSVVSGGSAQSALLSPQGAGAGDEPSLTAMADATGVAVATVSDHASKPEPIAATSVLYSTASMASAPVTGADENQAANAAMQQQVDAAASAAATLWEKGISANKPKYTHTVLYTMRKHDYSSFVRSEILNERHMSEAEASAEVFMQNNMFAPQSDEEICAESSLAFNAGMHSPFAAKAEPYGILGVDPFAMSYSPVDSHAEHEKAARPQSGEPVSGETGTASSSSSSSSSAAASVAVQDQSAAAASAPLPLDTVPASASVATEATTTTTTAAPAATQTGDAGAHAAATAAVTALAAPMATSPAEQAIRSLEHSYEDYTTPPQGAAASACAASTALSAVQPELAADAAAQQGSAARSTAAPHVAHHAVLRPSALAIALKPTTVQKHLYASGAATPSDATPLRPSGSLYPSSSSDPLQTGYGYHHGYERNGNIPQHLQQPLQSLSSAELSLERITALTNRAIAAEAAAHAAQGTTQEQQAQAAEHEAQAQVLAAEVAYAQDPRVISEDLNSRQPLHDLTGYSSVVFDSTLYGGDLNPDLKSDPQQQPCFTLEGLAVGQSYEHTFILSSQANRAYHMTIQALLAYQKGAERGHGLAASREIKGLDSMGYDFASLSYHSPNAWQWTESFEPLDQLKSHRVRLASMAYLSPDDSHNLAQTVNDAMFALERARHQLYVVQGQMSDVITRGTLKRIKAQVDLSPSDYYHMNEGINFEAIEPLDYSGINSLELRLSGLMCYSSAILQPHWPQHKQQQQQAVQAAQVALEAQSKTAPAADPMAKADSEVKYE